MNQPTFQKSMYHFCFSVFCLLISGAVFAQEDLDDREPKGYVNWKMPTLRGMQFWTNVRQVGGWSIQRNAKTGHYRLIDAKGFRQAWGNLPHCEQSLNDRITAGNVIPDTGKVVILLHGLGRTSFSMNSLAQDLQDNGYAAVNFQYASSQGSVDAHAADLRSVIDGLGDEITEINFVGHSLGNIVVRHYLADSQTDGQGVDPRIHRMVMLGPPNQGSRMARLFSNNLLFKSFAGIPGVQLGAGWDQLESRLVVPPIEFGIVAGGQDSEEDWSNFALEGPDDFTVELNETKLAGAQDLLVRPLFHSTMMFQPEVLESTRRFLEHGYFVSKNKRSPIPADWKYEMTLEPVRE